MVGELSEVNRVEPSPAVYIIPSPRSDEHDYYFCTGTLIWNDLGRFSCNISLTLSSPSGICGDTVAGFSLSVPIFPRQSPFQQAPHPCVPQTQGSWIIMSARMLCCVSWGYLIARSRGTLRSTRSPAHRSWFLVIWEKQYHGDFPVMT
jgi:hypothetical protein